MAAKTSDNDDVYFSYHISIDPCSDTKTAGMGELWDAILPGDDVAVARATALAESMPTSYLPISVRVHRRLGGRGQFDPVARFVIEAGSDRG